MDVLVFDAETFYSKEFSLSRMTTQEYIDDSRFELIGFAVKKNNEPTQKFSGSFLNCQHWLASFDWANSILVCHHAKFDASILSWKFGIEPKLVACTLSMGRALHGVSVGGSLKALSEHYGIGEKGTEVLDALGKRREDFTPEELARYMDYCANDVELTYKLFMAMAPRFNGVEMQLISATVKMHSEPMLGLDRAVLEQHLENVRNNKEKLLEESGLTSEDLRSDIKLAEVLRSISVEPPTKVSARTGKEAYAFAKSDQEFKDLLEHDDPRVQAIVAARLGVKTTIEESRTERFMSIHDAHGLLPVPLEYYKALTGRWAGAEKINLQNLPRTSALKKAIIAPLGYKIVGADLSAIELRVGLAFAGQNDKLKLLGSGWDLYKDFASSALNTPYDEIDDGQRFIGKTCIAEGELVLTERGLVPIEKIMVDDRVWDGIEWVQHDGVLYMGEKDVIEYQGLRATPDHIVYLESGKTCEFRDAANKRARIVNTGSSRDSIQLLDNHQYRDKEKQQSRRNAIAGAMRLWVSKMAAPRLLYAQTVEGMPYLRAEEEPCGAGAFDSSRQSYGANAKKSNIDIPTMQQLKRQELFSLWRSWDRVQVRVCEGASRLLENIARMGLRQGDRQNKERRALRAGESSLCYAQGTDEQSTEHFIRNMERGESPSGIMERKSVHERIYGMQVCSHGPNGGRDSTSSVGFSSQEVQKLANNKGKARVYDIVNAGPRHRFTVSNVLVSNCQLSLIYGTGAKKLRSAIKADAKYGKDIGEELSQQIVQTYRSEYANVKAAWYNAGKALEAIWLDQEEEIGLGPLKLRVEGSLGIKLPSGLHMQYPELGKATNEEGREQWTYKLKRGRSYETVYIHPAKCYQNVIQALARCIMGEAMARIGRRYPVKLTIHDAAYIVVPDAEAEEALKFVIRELKKPPVWMPDIPLDAEGGYGDNLSFKMSKVNT